MSEQHTIKHATGVAVFNGGEPLPGCPKSWDEAHAWEDRANVAKEEEWSEPNWKFDCGFKLDFDGSAVRISSRFYPPKAGYGPTWDGTVSLMVGDKTFHEKNFDCKSLDELRAKVESYVRTWKLVFMGCVSAAAKKLDAAYDDPDLLKKRTK